MDTKLRKRIIKEWTGNLPLNKKIIVLFERVRDIPYGSIGSRNPEDVYNKNKGTCSGKHELLKELYKELGIKVRDFVVTHCFNDLKIRFPSEIKEILKRNKIIDFHNFIKIFNKNKWVIIDATWDKPLKKLGFSVNENWNGKSDMKICVIPREIKEVNNPIKFKKQKLKKLPKQIQEDRELFLKKLTKWLDKLRQSNEI